MYILFQVDELLRPNFTTEFIDVDQLNAESQSDASITQNSIQKNKKNVIRTAENEKRHSHDNHPDLIDKTADFLEAVNNKKPECNKNKSLPSYYYDSNGSSTNIVERISSKKKLKRKKKMNLDEISILREENVVSRKRPKIIDQDQLNKNNNSEHKLPIDRENYERDDCNNYNENNEREREKSNDNENFERVESNYRENDGEESNYTGNQSVVHKLKEKLKRSRSKVRDAKAKINKLKDENENLKTFNLKLQQQLLTKSSRNNIVSIHSNSIFTYYCLRNLILS